MLRYWARVATKCVHKYYKYSNKEQRAIRGEGARILATALMYITNIKETEKDFPLLLMVSRNSEQHSHSKSKDIEEQIKF